MKIEIEIDEETAACVWANHNPTDQRSIPLEEIITDLAVADANEYRQAFPGAVSRRVREFLALQETP